MIQITSVYRKTSEGMLAQAFAVDLLRSLGGDTLYVFVPNCDPLQADAGVETLFNRQATQIVADVRHATGLRNVVLTRQIEGGIVVDHHGTALEIEWLDTLYPRRETTLLARARGPVLIPFGDSMEVTAAAERGFTIAKALALPVVLYHTTWKDTGVGSSDPAEHMCADAIEVNRRLEERAKALSIECKTVIETADDVVEGIIFCAMRESAVLLVMSRSSKTTVGCYVDQALKHSPVPLLAIAALDRRCA